MGWRWRRIDGEVGWPLAAGWLAAQRHRLEAMIIGRLRETTEVVL